MTDKAFDYVKSYPQLFFDINSNEDVKRIVEQANVVLSSLVDELSKTEDAYIQRGDSGDSYIYFVIMTFIRKIIEQLDAINILYSKCSFKAVEVILRSLFENHVGFEYIMQSDTEFRAVSYYLHHNYEEMEIAKKHFDPAQKSVLLSVMSQNEFNIMKARWDKKEAAIKRLIANNPVFQRVDTARQGLKYPKWYQLDGGPRNFKELVTAVGLDKYYDSIYGSLSFETHGLNAATEMNVKDDNLNLNLIRSPHNGSGSFSYACTFGMSSLHTLKKYMGLGSNREELDRFKTFFMDFTKKRDIVDHNHNMIML